MNRVQNSDMNQNIECVNCRVTDIMKLLKTPADRINMAKELSK